MMKFRLPLFWCLIFLIFSCQSDLIVGQYVLLKPVGSKIEEILEIKENKEFVFSGVKSENGELMTWVIEGEWELKNDKLILNSPLNRDARYGSQFNAEYLSHNVDSLQYLDQAIIICRDMTFSLEEGNLIFLEDGKKTTYYPVIFLLTK